MRERRRSARALQMAPGRRIPRPPDAPPPKPPPPADDIVSSPELAKSAGELQSLAQRIRSCEACGLTGGDRVFGTGYARAPVMLLGGHPSPDDLESGNALTAEAEPLGKAFEALGISASWVYGTAAARCAPHLLEEIEAVGPRVIVTFGEHALDAVRALDGRCGIAVPPEVAKGEPAALRPGLALVATEGLPEGVRDKEPKRLLWRHLQAVPKLLA